MELSQLAVCLAELSQVTFLPITRLRSDRERTQRNIINELHMILLLTSGLVYVLADPSRKITKLP